jgi:hypothetical protein
VERLKETLRQMLTLADKMVFLEKEMVVKHKEAEVEQEETQPKLELVIKRTKEMKKQVTRRKVYRQLCVIYTVR